MKRDLPTRFWAKVDKDGPGGCWLWLGSTTHGYGYVATGEGRQTRPAHIVAYLLEVGPIPEGMQLDHLCHRIPCIGGDNCPHRRCVNPDHLKPATPRENTLRSFSFAARYAAQTHCVNGHEFEYSAKRKRRDCRECMNANRRRRRREQADRRLAQGQLAV